MLLYDSTHTNFYHVLILFLSQLNHVINNLIPLLGGILYICGYKKYKLKSREHVILVKIIYQNMSVFPIYIMKIMNHVEH